MLVITVYSKTQNMVVQLLSLRQTLVTPWTAAHQALLSMAFPKQEHWSRLPFASLGDLPYSGIEPRSPGLQVDSLQTEPPRKTIKHTQSLIYLLKLKGISIYEFYIEKQITKKQTLYSVFYFKSTIQRQCIHLVGE